MQETIKKKRSQLKSEAQLYKLLQGIKGIPKFYWSGTEGGLNIMIMELLGPSLDNILCKYVHRFSIQTVLYLAEQMVFIGITNNQR